jgi:hypothetical protein
MNHLVNVDRKAKYKDKEQNSGKIKVFEIECPVRYTKYKKQVKRTKDLSQSDIHTAWLLHNHRARAIAIL